MRPNTPTEFLQTELQPFSAVEILFDSGAARLWTGYGDLVFDNKTFVGGGNFLNVSEIEETSEVEAKGIVLTLSGIPSELLSLAIGEPYQNRIMRLYVGSIKPDGSIEHYQIFAGRLDVMNILESGDSATITVSIENRLIDLNRPRIRRYTSEDQKGLFPGDLGFDYVNDLQDRPIDWGKSENQPATSISSSRSLAGSFDFRHRLR